MKEKRKTEKTKVSGGNSGSIFDSVPGIPTDKNCNVSSDPYAEDLPVAGMTVEQVRQRFSDRLDIDSESQSIINGSPVEGSRILEVGENLMFVRHAGEKGVNNVVIEGDRAIVMSPDVHEKSSMSVEDLCQRVGPGMSTGPVILPSGIKTVLSQGNLTLWFWEQPPRIHQLSWVREDSPQPFGGGTTYRNVRIALPYLVIMAVFSRYSNGIPNLMRKDEFFFRNEPLKSLDDELCYPALLNCSKFSGGANNGNPLSWICTQYLKQTKKMQSKDSGDRFQAGFEAVRYCLLETSFNLSSEHHEGNSWYGASKNIDPRIATIAEWEKATKKDPLFILDVPWIKTGHSVRKLAERTFLTHSEANGPVKSAEDLARIIINH